MKNSETHSPALPVWCNFRESKQLWNQYLEYNEMLLTEITYDVCGPGQLTNVGIEEDTKLGIISITVDNIWYSGSLTISAKHSIAQWAFGLFLVLSHTVKMEARCCKSRRCMAKKSIFEKSVLEVGGLETLRVCHPLIYTTIHNKIIMKVSPATPLSPLRFWALGHIDLTT